MTLLINRVIASELQVQEKQVAAAVQLLDEGSTVPFIARYRKEVTGGLDDTQLRHLEVRLLYLRELNQRRATILNSIEQQGKLSAELADAINRVMSKTELEDLYLPYKPKRRTRGQIAIEAGLAPLADQLWQQPDQVPEVLAEQFVDAEKGINDSKAALDGARYILMERFAEDAALLAVLRQYLWRHGVLIAKVLPDQAEAGAKFSDYFDYQEAIAKIPSHRALALFRGRNEGILQLSLQAEPAEQSASTSMGEQLICQHLGIVWQGQAADAWRQSVISWTWKIKLLLHLESELLATLREQAENEAINVFARNLRDLLMAAPAGMRVTIGLDPGLRTGVKVAVVDQTGKLLDTHTIYPHTGQAAQAAKQLSALCQQYQVELVAIGNGTASRETERFYAQLQQQYPQVSGQKVIVSEAGASVYSASALAAQEFPQLDVSLRGAVSIARRLQDPLAELVKIDPKSIGVGQYQHDVNQGLLAKKLDTVVEDCVNAVGVDLNTASVALLSRVAGLTESIAQNVVAWRDQHGRFTNRQQLKQVARLGDKTFEQCAGFLRIVGGDNPLDASTVHPESYPVVEKILQASQKTLAQLLGQPQWLSNLNAVDFVDEQIGLPTVRDILNELAKPGRDPRPEFKTASFTEGVNEITDLRVDMVLEGTVTNVTNFGAFVDIGVHQDGLVHISLLADKFVSDPHQVVKAGDIVTVKVVEVDTERKRIALSMRLNSASASSNDNKASSTTNNRQKHSKQSNTTSSPPSAMAAAFSAALTKK